MENYREEKVKCVACGKTGQRYLHGGASYEACEDAWLTLCFACLKRYLPENTGLVSILEGQQRYRRGYARTHASGASGSPPVAPGGTGH